MTIRYARPGEAGAIFRRTVKQWPRWWSIGRRLENGRQYFRKDVLDRRVLVAVEGGIIVGHLSWSALHSFIYIHEIVIDKEYWRTGVASRLIERCAAVARQRGAETIVADCWEGNHASEALGQKAGFRMAGYVARLWSPHPYTLWMRRLQR